MYVNSTKNTHNRGDTAGQYHPRSPRPTKIITAAKQLFLTRGYAKTSMETIRVEAGVSKQTLYNHFKNKEDLYMGIMTLTLDEFAQKWSAAPAREIIFESREQLQAVLTKLAHDALTRLLNAEHVELTRTVIRSIPQFPTLAETFRLTVPTRALEIVVHLLESAQEQNIINVADINTASRMFMGSILYYFMLNGLLDDQPDYPEAAEIDAAVKMFVKIL